MCQSRMERNGADDMNSKQENLERCLELLRTGKDTGKLLYKRREELYECSVTDATKGRKN